MNYLKSTISRIAAATLLVAAAIVGANTAMSQTSLVPGDIAIIGWVDNASPNDLLSFVTLTPIASGTQFYFTDNGWTGTTYRGHPTVGLAGNEGVTRWTATSNVPAGTIVSTYGGTFGTWTVSGQISTPTGAANSFTAFNFSQTGDQVAIFQSSNGADPLGSVTSNIYSIDDTGTYEPATNSNTGDVPPGLTLGTDAVSFAQNTAGLNFMGFNPPALLQTNGGTKGDWLAAIADSTNWTFASSGTLPSGSLNVVWTGASVTTDPSSTSACIGGTASFGVVADGGGISYQWRLGTIPIIGAESATYTIPSVTLADVGSYDCVVTNLLGTATSLSATLTIDPLPVITSDPSSITVGNGSPAVFTVAATGVGLTFQWRKDTNPISGEVLATLTIGAATFADQGTYDCVVTNACGSVTSLGAVLTVTSVPGPGQPGDPTAALLDINGSLNANGNPVNTLGDMNGPFFATASSATGLTFTFAGEPNQPIILILGPLNPDAADFTAFGIGTIDVGVANPLPPFIPNNIVTVVDGTQLDFFSSLFNTGTMGQVVYTFPTYLPPGLIGGFQAIIYNSVTVIRASNAVELTIL